jgi:hypothetical protein
MTLTNKGEQIQGKKERKEQSLKVNRNKSES